MTRLGKARRHLVAVIIALVLLPLGASAVDQIFAVGSSYHPVGDLAAIELHTRDVGLHQVELGQFSRDDWSHPGPALFYALAVPYRLSGSSSIGNSLGALLINGLSVAGILVLANRRGGQALLWITAVGCALLLRSFGPEFLVEPWNPLVPVLPFGLFLFLTWEMTCGEAWALPAAAAVGTFCVQTHIGYLPLVLPLGAVGAASILWMAVRSPDRDTAGSGPRSIRRPLFLTVAALSLMWIPPIVQQLRPGKGNLSRALHYFLHGAGQAHTLRDGYADVAVQFSAAPEWITGHIGLTKLTAEPDLARGAPLPMLLVPFVIGAIIWWRRRSSNALRLVGLVGVAIGLSALAVARTIGPIYHYRLGWTRVIAMVALVAAMWALWEVLVDRWPTLEGRVLVPLALLGLIGLSAFGVPQFARTGPPGKPWSDNVARLVPKLADLRRTKGVVILRCDGDDSCIYLSGFVLWFERHGVKAQVESPFNVVAGGSPHRVYKRGPVWAVLHVAENAHFYVDAAMPNRKVIAYVGAPPSAERARLANQFFALAADFARGRLSRAAYFFQRTDLVNRLGDAVGVLSEPLKP